MRVWLDIRPMAHQGVGIGIYTTSLVRHLAQEAGEDTELILDYASLRGSQFIPDEDLEGAADILWGGGVRWLVGKAWERGARTPALERFAGELSVAHGTNYVVPPTRKARRIVTVHDLTAVTHPEWHTPIARRMARRWKETLPDVDRIITVSESTKSDLCRLLPIPAERVDVVPLAPGPAFTKAVPAQRRKEVLERYGLTDQPYVLHVGSLEPRKNVARLVTAFARASTDEVLVLAAAAGWSNEDVFAAIDEHDLKDRIRFTGFVEPENLPALYSAARVVAYPSLYEGFGLPVIEALACGAPVLTSSISSIPEVAGDAAVLVDPTDIEALTAELKRLLSSEEDRNALAAKGPTHAAGFTWEQTARRTLDAYRRALEPSSNGE